MDVRETGYVILYLRMIYASDNDQRAKMISVLNEFIDRVKLTEIAAIEQGLAERKDGLPTISN